MHQDNPDKFAVVQGLATEVDARTMELDEDRGTVYLITAGAGPTSILSVLLEIFYSVAALRGRLTNRGVSIQIIDTPDSRREPSVGPQASAGLGHFFPGRPNLAAL